MAITEQLAHLIAETTFKKLPVSAVTQAKRALLDTIGVTLAGHGEDAGKIITAFVKDVGGHPEAAILGTSLYTSPGLAALANGTLGHASAWTSQRACGPSGASARTIVECEWRGRYHRVCDRGRG
jgi:2-methylcitrate dehydratase PrpD